MIDPLTRLVAQHPAAAPALLILAGMAVATVVGTLVAGLVAWAWVRTLLDVEEIVRELRRRER